MTRKKCVVPNSEGQDLRVKPKKECVFIPPWARSVISDGKIRLYRRFLDPEAGKTWKKEIQLQIQKLKANAQAASVGVAPKKTRSFRAAYGFFLEEADLKPRSREWYTDVIRGRLDQFFGDMKICQIDGAAIKRYLDYRRSGKLSSSKDALHKDLTVIRRVLSWSKDSGYQVKKSAWKMKKPKVVAAVKRRYDPELAQRFLTAAKGRDRVLIEVALATGMRRDELKSFHVSWIHWDSHVIQLPADKTKDSEARSVPMFPHLEAILREWLGDRRTGLVFPPLRNGASGTGTARGADLIGIFRRIRKATGIPFRGWHDFRHHYISMLFKLNRPIPEIMQITGIDDMETLTKYAHASSDFLKDVTAALAREVPGRGPSGPTAPKTAPAGSGADGESGPER